jgi:hypothetical protein
VRAGFDRFPSGLLDGAVADLMADGTLLRHVRRMRGRYRAARDALAAALADAAGAALRVVVPAEACTSSPICRRGCRRAGARSGPWRMSRPCSCRDTQPARRRARGVDPGFLRL